MRTYDTAAQDAAGAFLVGELERLDPKLYLPLAAVTWHRDIDLREDVTIGDEASSFTVTDLGAPGGVSPTGKNWIGKKSTAVPGISVRNDKQSKPLHLWGMELGWSLPELVASQQLGRPIDSQKLDALRLKENMDTDEMVYIGDEDLGVTGLVNNADISPVSITTPWDDDAMTAKVILDDINGIIETAWKASGYSVCPTHLLLPPAKFGQLVEPVSAAGSDSILEYVAKKCLSFVTNGRPLVINACKWLTGRGVAGADRAVAYSKAEMYVRFPKVPLQRTPLESRGIHQLCTYYGKFGEVEFVYPETVGYADGL